MVVKCAACPTIPSLARVIPICWNLEYFLSRSAAGILHVGDRIEPRVLRDGQRRCLRGSCGRVATDEPARLAAVTKVAGAWTGGTGRGRERGGVMGRDAVGSI